MKKHLLLLALLLNTAVSFSQSQFIIAGKTNYIANGKAILGPASASYFYSSNFKYDTVPVRNHAFLLKDMIKSPAFFRLVCLDDNGKVALSEPFFVDSGSQTLTFDSTTVKHDPWTSGLGVLVAGSKTNDEYVHDFLPLYDHVNQEIAAYFHENAVNLTIKDKQAQKDSMTKTAAKRLSIRKISDSILYEYAAKNPQSPIIPSLVYDAALRHDYSDYYYKAYEKITSYLPKSTNAGLKAFLDIEKLKGVGNVFPLLDFMQANLDNEGLPAKYTLVDFWFSSCAPCIYNFSLLKDTYKKFHDKGFNIVAIASDKKESLPNYERVINKYQYKWDQVLDLDGVRTKSINIKIFPSTFLLDSQGKIIETFVNPILLDAFLAKNL